MTRPNITLTTSPLPPGESRRLAGKSAAFGREGELDEFRILHVADSRVELELWAADKRGLLLIPDIQAPARSSNSPSRSIPEVQPLAGLSKMDRKA